MEKKYIVVSNVIKITFWFSIIPQILIFVNLLILQQNVKFYIVKNVFLIMVIDAMNALKIMK